ncbi:unnamed protein product [Agarophyton chilense]|eukprot:gb/GEZJ01000489.1/.p1 GENE.gb/GEZJ01000489.1/~~gb/GEZJ01000489.1/.p1  ORF type:complete len:1142 (-),score=194.29 gb/GEZJ01000489.1/:440-3865(-)
MSQKMANAEDVGQLQSGFLKLNIEDTFASVQQQQKERTSLKNLETPSDVAVRQNVFNLASVFDPANLKDLELFGLSGEQGFDTDSDDDDDDLLRISRDKAKTDPRIKRLENQFKTNESTLDAELDVAIGESYGGSSDLRNLRKQKSKADQRNASKAEEVWAIYDKADISNFEKMVPDMAIEYPFTLDTFQKRAVHRLERDENVFVAAHTSAGKTVVAEYAIALAMQRKSKVIYTSPIKTLSNQKFRDFTERFGDVGIITGDISINPEAGCLVVTTEILRSMLYKGADLIRHLSHVIFDECHWVNNPERGVVWEESIILLPTAVNIVMLSATVPNAMEFASWVGRTRQKAVYVVSTRQRPVPLVHQVFIKGKTFSLLNSADGRFLDANYKKAATRHKEMAEKANIRFGGGRFHAWMPIIKYLRKNSLDPAIFFCFSKRKCDDAAQQLSAQDLTGSAADKNQIHMFYQSAIARLSPVDRDVPQIARHRETLKRGIGVHHAGLLPIIKEITEVLFQRGLIRILFATETFAMGVNMPARTVVFSAIKKYDSQSFRLLEPGEYIQMAGRAGRRGIDDVGSVILYPVLADFPLEGDVKSVLTRRPKPLKSQFRLTYNMILNLLRIDEMRVEDVMARSFSEAPAGRTSSTVQRLMKRGNAALSAMQEEQVELDRFRELYHVSIRVQSLSERIGEIMKIQGKNAMNSMLDSGRVVFVRGGDQTFRAAVIVKGWGSGRGKGGASSKPAGPSLRLVRRNAAKNSESGSKVMVLCGGPRMNEDKTPFRDSASKGVDKNAANHQYNAGGLIVEVREVSYKDVMAVTGCTIEIDKRGIVPIRGEPMKGALSSAAEKLRSYVNDEANSKEMDSVHPRRDLGLQNIDIEDVWEERRNMMQHMNGMVVKLQEMGMSSEIGSSFEKLSRQMRLESKLEKLRIGTSDESLMLMPDYQQRVEVLQRLGYIDGTSVRLKGRAACEVNTCESIILTELVFEQVLQKLDAADLAAVLSAFVFTEKIGNDEGQFSVERLDDECEDLKNATKATVAVLHSLGEMQAECGIATSGFDYLKANGKFAFVKGVRDWARGMTFAEVCASYDGEVPEGSIVRTIVRLCELIRELKNVGRVIGDPDLQSKADHAIDLCRRDVIFAASLYVQ